jgi:hypothetical protein
VNKQKKNEADLHEIGFELKTNNFTGGENKAFSIRDYTMFDPSHQCQSCAIYETRLRQMENQCRRLAAHIDRSEARL